MGSPINKIPSIQIDNVPIKFIDHTFIVGTGDVHNRRGFAASKYQLEFGGAHLGVIAYSKEDKGKWNRENGTLVMINEYGVCVTPDSNLAVESLKNRGNYQYDPNLSVPLNPEMVILDPSLQQKWEELEKYWENLEQALN